MISGKKYMVEESDKRGFKNIIEKTLLIGASPNIGEFFPFLSVFDLRGLNSRLKDLAKIFDELFKKVIDEHVHLKERNNQAKEMVNTMMIIMQSGEAEFKFDLAMSKMSWW